jgi:hypothetical protein
MRKALMIVIVILLAGIAGLLVMDRYDKHVEKQRQKAFNEKFLK